MSKRSWLQWLNRKDVQYNMNHPEYRDKIEFAFKCDGTDYYQFKEEHEIPTGRYIHVDACLREHQMRMSLDLLKAFLEELKNSISGKQGDINLHNANVIIYNIETRTNLAFDPATIKRLASVIYFDKSERLNTYDKDHGNEKIQYWDKNKFLDFFFCRPIRELLGLQGTSPESIQNYMEEATQILRDLNFDPSTLSKESI